MIEKFYADANGVYADGTLIGVVNIIRKDGLKEDSELAAKRAKVMASAPNAIEALVVLRKAVSDLVGDPRVPSHLIQPVIDAMEIADEAIDASGYAA